MIKIFLVEDEKIVREGIKTGIPWERHGFEFVGEAPDGELAFPLIQEKRPDILLTDIRMPFMDGLELAELVKRELPDTRVMFFSGYDDFDYAKRAIRIGAADYLLKPISSEKLLEALERMSESIVQQRNEKEYRLGLERMLEERLMIERDRLFDDMVAGRMPLTEMMEAGKKHHLNLSASRYNLLLFQTSTAADQEQYSADKVAFEAELNAAMEKESRIISFNRLSEGYAFLIKGIDDASLERQIEHLRDLLKTLAGRYSNMQYFGGIGTPVVRLGELGECYQSANRVFAHRYLMEPNQILREQDLHAGQELLPDMSIKSMDVGNLDRSIIANFLKNGSEADAEYFVDEYFAGFGENVNSVMFRQYLVLDLYMAVTGFVTQLGLDPEDLVANFGDLDGLQPAITAVKSSVDCAKTLVKTAIGLRVEFSQKKYRLVLEKARDYIKNHYQDEDISLNVVASCVNISPNHFSSIFSQEMGTTFIEYLTNTRMEAARTLMRTTCKRTSEISYDVGYKDPHYFSYLFKKTQGMTPKDFRAGKKDE